GLISSTGSMMTATRMAFMVSVRQLDGRLTVDGWRLTARRGDCVAARETKAEDHSSLVEAQQVLVRFWRATVNCQPSTRGARWLSTVSCPLSTRGAPKVTRFTLAPIACDGLQSIGVQPMAAL